MARVGRKRKAGKRTKMGALVRTPQIDKGCDGVIRRRALFGIYAEASDGEAILVDASQTFDALGRAWSAGLLGEPDRANRYRDSGRAIAAQYWRIYGFLTPDSLARFQPISGGGIGDPEKEKAREDALNRALASVQSEGASVARAFSQLVVDMNPDHGPAWLDRILFAKRKGEEPSEADMAMLDRALTALSVVA
jgi:hypothetical protein